MRQKRPAFTMLELIFVIVIIAILSKFGVELFKQTFEGYVRSLYINELQTKSANAIQTLVNRLSYRIKDSIRSTNIAAGSVSWKGMDIDGWLAGDWSGIIDLDGSSATTLSSPGTTAGTSELFFVGSNIGTGSPEFHSVTVGTGTISGNFAGSDVYEYFQMTDGDHNLSWSTATNELLLDRTPLVNEVSDFYIEKLGDGLHVHLCLAVNGDPVNGHPLVKGQVCKDKFVF